MKFTYKLFFSITALLTAAFMLFGSFMLFSYFNRMLERETEQGKRENLLFQTIYDMVYQNMEKYGAEFAGIQAGNSATERMTDQNGMECMILETDGTITLEGSLKLPQDEIRRLAEEMLRTMDPGADQVYGVRKVGTCYYLLSIITDQATDSADTVYLGILKDLSGIYEERSSMMRQYGIALAGLLVIGGLAAFLLSRYLTRPIEQLNRTAGRIAGGDFEKRAVYQGTDEIGELSRSFNRMTDRLVRQMEEKELEAKQKEDFTAAFAHELKTPLTSIIGYVDLLSRDQTLSAESRDYVTILINKTERLKSIISDLFELAKATSGDAKVDLEEMDMKRLVEQTLGDMADQIEESGFAIRYQCEATHTRFIGDSSRMYRVVQNVIENALKYSLKGTRIFLRITEADQNIKLEVINTASYEMNFTEEEIMERFARAEKSRTSEGNGLGLSIADSFTKNCGGEFSIRIDGDQFLVTIQFKQHLDVNK